MMSEKDRSAALYKKGYRIRVTLGHMIRGSFRASEIAPLYVKSSLDVGPLMQTYYKNYVCETAFIDADSDQVLNVPESETQSFFSEP